MSKLFFITILILFSVFSYSQDNNDAEEAKEKRDSRRQSILDVRKKAAELPAANSLNADDTKKAEQLIKDLGANHFKIRKKAKNELTEMGFPVVAKLKEHLGKTEDPEVSESIKEIIAKLTHRLHPSQLDENQKAIAKLQFNRGNVVDNNINCEYYNYKGHFIIDIGLTRMVFPNEVKEATSHTNPRDINMIVNGESGGGGSSSINNFKIYEFSYQSGVGYWMICGQSFQVSNFTLEIGKKKLDLKVKSPQILYFDKGNKPIGILDIK